MSPGLLFLLAAQVVGSDPLTPAREAFGQGEYARAEKLALAVAVPPRKGAALYLAGLARFRAGRPADALAAFDAAGLATDPPARPLWQFNRAACLYQLARFKEAEAAYVEAGESDPTFAAVALANAGFAALDRGDLARSRLLMTRARRAAGPTSRKLVDDLEAQIAAASHAGRPGANHSAQVAELDELGMSAYGAGRFDEAQVHFRAALELEPLDGRSLIMAGAAALALGARGEARAYFEKALATDLEPTDARLARDYLDRACYGLASRGLGWERTFRIGAAYDGNVLQSGLAGSQEFVAVADQRIGSAALTAGASVTRRWRLAGAVVLEADLLVDQFAYLDSRAEDYSIQQDGLKVAAEYSPGGPLRLGFSSTGQLAFTGLSRFRSLQAAGGLGAWTALDESDLTSSRLDVEWSHKKALRPEFEYLTGDRVDLAASQQIRLGRLSIDLSYRHADDRIGTLQQPISLPAQTTWPLNGPQNGTYVVPFDYSSHALGAAARIAPGPAWQLGLSSGLEWRAYAGDSYLWTDATTVFLERDRRRREDRRFLATGFGAVRLSPAVSLSVRYDLIVNASNVEFSYDDRNYVRHLVAVETILNW